MAFGQTKSGTNTTDKKMIVQLHKAEWPIDKIAAKLSVHEKHVEAVIKASKAKSAKGGDPKSAAGSKA